MSKPITPANPILSARIKETRMWIKDGSKMTQLELADAIGVDEQTIRKYEKGKDGVPKMAVAAIANAFGCCVEYLYGKTNCFTAEEYQQEQDEIKDLVSNFERTQSKVKEQWSITKSFFQEFLGYTVRDTYMRKDNGSAIPSFIPVIAIMDPQGIKYTFGSRSEAEAFLLSYYEDAAKLLRYRLLDYADSKTATKPTPAP